MAQRNDLEAFRDEITELWHRDASKRQLHSHINALIAERGGRPVAFRTVERKLASWGLTKYSTVQDLEPFYEEICILYDDGVSIDHILTQANALLAAKGLQDTSKRSLERKLESWGLNKRQKKVVITEQLIDRIKHYFFDYGFSDQSIPRDLTYRDKLEASLHVIRQVRWSHGMKRRARTEAERLEQLNKAIAFLREDLERTSAIRGFGKGLLYHYVRQQGRILVSQRRLYDFYRQAFPEEVARRREASFRQRGNFIVPGPNFMWSLDGYDKLRRFGFQIYGCIDAFSRCIIWLYVGRSATTAISTLKQYLQTVQRLQMRPFFTRSDYGSETLLWAAAQATLAKAGPQRLRLVDNNGIDQFYQQGDRLESCHLYGPSTGNIRIESWWLQLRLGATSRWITFFNELTSFAILREGNVDDQIAIYAIFGPMIRDELAQFVRLWNGHTIRNQPNRPGVKAGIPADLYHIQDTEDWGVSLGDDNGACQQLLHDMLEPLHGVDIDQLLPPEVEAWCESQLLDLGFEGRLDYEPDDKRPYIPFFLNLVARIEHHREAGFLPLLTLSPIPRGGRKEFEQLLQRNYQSDPGLVGDALPAFFQEQINEAHNTDIDL